MTERRKRKSQPRYLDGAALRRKRIEANIEQAELGARCGTTQGQISSWERGTYGCRIGMLHKLAEALGCDPAALMRKDAAGPQQDGAAA